jgi:hypothetical protein
MTDVKGRTLAHGTKTLQPSREVCRLIFLQHVVSFPASMTGRACSVRRFPEFEKNLTDKHNFK